MPADVGGLPDASSDQFPQAGIRRQAVTRAAEIPLAVGADEVVRLRDAGATLLEGVCPGEIEREHVVVADALEAEQTRPQRPRTASSGPCRSRGGARTAAAPRAPEPRSLPPGCATTGFIGDARSLSARALARHTGAYSSSSHDIDAGRRTVHRLTGVQAEIGAVATLAHPSDGKPPGAAATTRARSTGSADLRVTGPLPALAMTLRHVRVRRPGRLFIMPLIRRPTSLLHGSQHGPLHRRGNAAPGGPRVRLHLLQHSDTRRRRAADRRVARGGRRVLHGLSALHQHPWLHARNPRGLGPLQDARRPGRGVAVPGAHHRGFGHRRHRQHRRGGGRDLHRRARRHVLADRLGTARHVHEVRRVHTRGALPARQPGRFSLRRAHVLPRTGPRRASLAAARQGPGHVLCSEHGDRLPGHRQHVPVQPGNGDRGGRDRQHVAGRQRMARRRHPSRHWSGSSSSAGSSPSPRPRCASYPPWRSSTSSPPSSSSP